jgi:hypothetical protein
MMHRAEYAAIKAVLAVLRLNCIRRPRKQLRKMFVRESPNRKRRATVPRRGPVFSCQLNLGGSTMTKTRAFLGCVALTAYLLLFSAGMFLSSKPYVDTLKNSAPFGLSAAHATSTDREPDAGPKKLLEAGVFISTFLWAMCLFTPINVAFLTVIAGFLGGCASNITYSRPEAKAVPELQAVFRRESPFASMIRSFIVYLAFIAGIYITTTAPFENPDANQYVRFAGTISLFAFVVGYDPTKFQDWIKWAGERGAPGGGNGDAAAPAK